jgi:hypothetical protein
MDHVRPVDVWVFPDPSDFPDLGEIAPIAIKRTVGALASLVGVVSHDQLRPEPKPSCALGRNAHLSLLHCPAHFYIGMASRAKDP